MPSHFSTLTKVTLEEGDEKMREFLQRHKWIRRGLIVLLVIFVVTILLFSGLIILTSILFGRGRTANILLTFIAGAFAGFFAGGAYQRRKSGRSIWPSGLSWNDQRMQYDNISSTCTSGTEGEYKKPRPSNAMYAGSKNYEPMVQASTNEFRQREKRARWRKYDQTSQRKAYKSAWVKTRRNKSEAVLPTGEQLIDDILEGRSIFSEIAYDPKMPDEVKAANQRAYSYCLNHKDEPKRILVAMEKMRKLRYYQNSTHGEDASLAKSQDLGIYR